MDRQSEKQINSLTDELTNRPRDKKMSRQTIIYMNRQIDATHENIKN